MLVKISHLRDPEDIDAIASMNPTYMGFDFRPLSERYMGEVESFMFSRIPPQIRKTGLFSDEDTLRIIAIAGRYTLNTVQLDGNESPSQCEELSAEGLEIIKTITDHLLDHTDRYEGVCNRFIFRLSDPAKAENYKGRTPFLIETEKLTLPTTNPLCCGADCGEMLEQHTAHKDLQRIRSYITNYQCK